MKGGWGGREIFAYMYVYRMLLLDIGFPQKIRRQEKKMRVFAPPKSRTNVESVDHFREEIRVSKIFISLEFVGYFLPLVS